MSKLLSIRAYARLRGVSHVAVLKAAQRGRISLVNGQVDPEAADQQWEANTVGRVGREAAETGASGKLKGGLARPSDERLAVQEYLFGCADRLAPLLAQVSAPSRMGKLLRVAMEEICDELERAGLV